MLFRIYVSTRSHSISPLFFIYIYLVIALSSVSTAKILFANFLLHSDKIFFSVNEFSSPFNDTRQDNTFARSVIVPVVLGKGCIAAVRFQPNKSEKNKSKVYPSSILIQCKMCNTHNPLNEWSRNIVYRHGRRKSGWQTDHFTTI